MNKIVEGTIQGRFVARVPDNVKENAVFSKFHAEILKIAESLGIEILDFEID